MSTKSVVDKFISFLESQDFMKAFGMLSETGPYTIIGTTKASGTYNGRGEVFEKLIPLLSTFKGPPALKFSSTIVEGENAALVASGSGDGPTGYYDQPNYAFIIRVQGDEIVAITEFMDTVMMETAIFGKSVN